MSQVIYLTTQVSQRNKWADQAPLDPPTELSVALTNRKPAVFLPQEICKNAFIVAHNPSCALADFAMWLNSPSIARTVERGFFWGPFRAAWPPTVT